MIVKAHACTYGWSRSQPHWQTMARTLTRQLAEHGIPLHIQVLDRDPGMDDLSTQFLPKLESWARAAGTQDCDRLLLTDLDMLLVRAPDLSQFTAPVTTTITGPGSINTGQMVVRPGPDAQDILTRMLSLAQKPPARTWDKYMAKHHAPDQAALARILDREPDRARHVQVVPECPLNLCTGLHRWDRAWFVHIKSGLRVRVWDLDRVRYTEDKLVRIPDDLVEWCRGCYGLGPGQGAGPVRDRAETK